MDIRKSHGLEQFCSSLEDRPGQSVLDLAGANQSTISFITNQGHRLYSNDFLHQLEQVFGLDELFYANQSNHHDVETFLLNAVDFQRDQFDGALVWDMLEYLSASLVSTVVGRLHQILRPGASLLAIFHADERVDTVPLYSYRIQDQHTMQLVPRGRRRPAQIFNNRGIERLFQDFESVKFFLTRDHLREVIVKR